MCVYYVYIFNTYIFSESRLLRLPDAELVKRMLSAAGCGGKGTYDPDYYYSICRDDVVPSSHTWHCKVCKKCDDWREWHCKSCNRCRPLP